MTRPSPSQPDTETLVARAEALAADHHRLCNSRRGEKCDCYNADRDRHRFARAFLALAARLAETERDLRMLSPEKWEYLNRANVAEAKAEAAERRVATLEAALVWIRDTGVYENPDLHRSLIQERADDALDSAASQPAQANEKDGERRG